MGQLPLIRLSTTGNWVRTVSGWLKTRFGSYWPSYRQQRSRWAKTSCRIAPARNWHGDAEHRADPDGVIRARPRPPGGGNIEADADQYRDDQRGDDQFPASAAPRPMSSTGAVGG
jgi:hypothetical protein